MGRLPFWLVAVPVGRVLALVAAYVTFTRAALCCCSWQAHVECE